MAENNNNNRRRKPKTNSYKPKGDKEILAKNILELNLCEKTYEILTNGRVTIIADLLQYREKELYRIQNFNKKCMLEVVPKVIALGVSFREPFVPKPKVEGETTTETPKKLPPKTQAQTKKQPERKGELNNSNGAKTIEAYKNDNNKSKQVSENAPVIASVGRIKVDSKGRVIKTTLPQRDERVSRNNSSSNNRNKNKNNNNTTSKNNNTASNNNNSSKGKNSWGDALMSSGKKWEPHINTNFVLPKLPKDALVPFMNSGKFGYKTVKGMTIIPAIYDDAFLFSEGLASVEKSGKYGFIDKNNNIVIEFKYDLAMSFSNGLACVVIGEKCGYIDKNGEWLIQPKYEAGTMFEEDELARVKIDGNWAHLDREGVTNII